MTTDEQDAAILALVKDRSQFRQRKNLIESELERAGRSLEEIGSAVKHVSGLLRFDTVSSTIMPKIAAAPEICDLSRIRTMLEELIQVSETLKRMDQRAETLKIA